MTATHHRKWLFVTPLLVGLAFFGLAQLRTAQYAAETTFFVPLTLLERQIQQNGIGFGSPSEVDAHLELLTSQAVEEVLTKQLDGPFSLDVSKTRNGAVRIVATANDPQRAADLANRAVVVGDSIKQAMLRQNVGQSYAFVASKTEALIAEEAVSRRILDSIRQEAEQDSVAFAALEFKQEHAYGSIVSELTQSERKKIELERYLQAPAPTSYLLSKAVAPTSPKGLPAWAIALLAATLTALAQYAVRVYFPSA